MATKSATISVPWYKTLNREQWRVREASTVHTGTKQPIEDAHLAACGANQTSSGRAEARLS